MVERPIPKVFFKADIYVLFLNRNAKEQIWIRLRQ